ncbi:bifunctional hydroxymethylpyrimidine kinase/phosphomethylpyrimidine kinase, partial [Staphylococcus aureus]|uniref:bifunctional hydroxymethylpyrimidine kinase/phosphomethylpyrimidine kinase n=1 Tax=Staphylococcus aureus TaxID=1280 RepID=UPI0021096BF6
TIDRKKKIMQTGRIIINKIVSKSDIIKNSHTNDTDIAKDNLITIELLQTIENEPFKTKHTHATRSTFSAVITAELAKGGGLCEAVIKSKKFTSMCIQYTPAIRSGRGPVTQFAYLREAGLDDELSR